MGTGFSVSITLLPAVSRTQSVPCAIYIVPHSLCQKTQELSSAAGAVLSLCPNRVLHKDASRGGSLRQLAVTTNLTTTRIAPVCQAGRACEPMASRGTAAPAGKWQQQGWATHRKNHCLHCARLSSRSASPSRRNPEGLCQPFDQQAEYCLLQLWGEGARHICENQGGDTHTARCRAGTARAGHEERHLFSQRWAKEGKLNKLPGWQK